MFLVSPEGVPVKGMFLVSPEGVPVKGMFLVTLRAIQRSLDEIAEEQVMRGQIRMSLNEI